MIKTLIDYIVNLFIGQSYGNDEIIYYTVDKGLLNYLHYNDLVCFVRLNKYFNNNDFLIKDLHKKYIYKHFDNTFIPYSILYNASIIKWQQKFMTIDYIDRLTPKTLENYLMIGVDCWKRPFISIKYKYNNSYEYNGLLTIFQRYNNNRDDWRKGNPTGPFLKCCGEGGLSKNDKIRFLDNINSIIDKKFIIKINDFAQAYSGDYDFDSNLEIYKEIPIKI